MNISDYRLSPIQKRIEIVRPYILLVGYIWSSLYGIWWLSVLFAATTCFAAFTQMHDTIHHALGLPKRTNEFLLGLSGLLILKSGHGSRATHLLHHNQCLGDKDPEGAPANWNLLKVLTDGPYHVFSLRFISYKISPTTRKVQFVETAVSLVLILSFVALYYYTHLLIGLIYWATIVVVSSLMPLWATFIPHKLEENNQARLLGVRLARIWTPIIASFAYHDLHHSYPKIPTVMLPKAGKEQE